MWTLVKQFNRFKIWFIGLFIIPVALASGGVVIDNNINPYTDKVFGYEIQIDKGNEGFEKTTFSKAKPEMTLSKWNNEVQMSVSYSEVKGEGQRKLLSNKIEWQGTDEKVVAYPLTDGYEFEIELAKKPISNRFDFEIKGAENLNFWYQPPLTQQEIDDGSFRPDNVIGSYAVYHKTKKNYIKGQTNYTTGKVFHIYRPKAIDAKGKEQWAVLDYKNSILTVIVPQLFLDTAIYPVIIDPTFGYTTAGGSSENWSANYILYSGTYTYSPASDGTLDSISTYSKYASGSGNAKMAIYDDSENLIDDTGGVAIGSSLAWKTVNVVSGSSIDTGTNYRLVIKGDVLLNHAYDVQGGSTHKYWYASNAYGDAFPDPVTWTKSSGTDREYSIYATYTAAAAGGVNPNGNYQSQLID